MNLQKVWSYLPVDYRSWPSKLSPQRQELDLKADFDTKMVRLLFTNENGVMPLELADLTLSIFRHKRCIQKVPILFQGKNELRLDLDESIKSDPISVDLHHDDELKVTVLLPHTTYLSSGVVTYAYINHMVKHFTFEGKTISPEHQFIMVRNNSRMHYFFGLYGLEMALPSDKEIITVFGDSIVQQGFFTNYLREQLQDYRSNYYSVNNAGIGGNRVLYDTDPEMDCWLRHGIAGINRFEKDVFSGSKPDTVMVCHGLNDIIQETIHPGDLEDLDKVIQGLMFYVDTIHHHDAKAYIGTIMPLGHSIFYSDHVEAQRQKMNKWIRQQQYYDGVIDFDNVMRSPENPLYLKKDYDSGDGLHPSDAGGKRMAKAAVDLMMRSSDE